MLMITSLVNSGFSTFSESYKSALRSFLTCESLEVPKFMSQIKSIELSTSLKALVGTDDHLPRLFHGICRAPVSMYSSHIALADAANAPPVSDYHQCLRQSAVLLA